MPHFHEQLDDAESFGVPEGLEACRNELCGKEFWPSQSTAKEFSRYCSQECQDDEAEAEL